LFKFTFSIILMEYCTWDWYCRKVCFDKVNANVVPVLSSFLSSNYVTWLKHSCLVDHINISSTVKQAHLFMLI